MLNQTQTEINHYYVQALEFSFAPSAQCLWRDKATSVTINTSARLEVEDDDVSYKCGYADDKEQRIRQQNNKSTDGAVGMYRCWMCTDGTWLLAHYTYI